MISYLADRKDFPNKILNEQFQGLDTVRFKKKRLHLDQSQEVVNGKVTECLTHRTESSIRIAVRFLPRWDKLINHFYDEIKVDFQDDQTYDQKWSKPQVLGLLFCLKRSNVFNKEQQNLFLLDPVRKKTLLRHPFENAEDPACFLSEAETEAHFDFQKYSERKIKLFQNRWPDGPICAAQIEKVKVPKIKNNSLLTFNQEEIKKNDKKTQFDELQWAVSSRAQVLSAIDIISRSNHEEMATKIKNLQKILKNPVQNSLLTIYFLDKC